MSATMDDTQIAALMIRARESRPKLNECQFMNELTEVMARLLHYQDSGEPGWNLPTEELVREYEKLPKRIINRYVYDVKFRNQVTRALASVLDLVSRRSEEGY